MKWLEANPLPDTCVACREEDCYNCENAGKRWYLSGKDALMLRRKMLTKAIERLQKQIEGIDKELEEISVKSC